MSVAFSEVTEMDLRMPTPLNLTRLEMSRKKPSESTIDVIQCLAEMKIAAPILVREPDMYKFIYNINRQRKNTLPSDFKYLSRGRKYITVQIPELESLMVIRVR